MAKTDAGREEYRRLTRFETGIKVCYHQIARWKIKWQSTSLSELPKNALDTYNKASAACIRNVRRLLQLINVKFLSHDIHMRKLMTIFQFLATLPVTIAFPERSFSQLRARNICIRGSMKEERLYGLASPRVHSDKEVPSDKIMDDFAKMKVRRLKVAL